MHLQKTLVTILICGSALLSSGQASLTEKQQAVAVLRSLSDHYRNAGSLHFIISYRYSAEDKPGVYLDSLKGYFTMSGTRYRYVVDSTEFIGNKDRVVVLYKQDRVMYLAKASPAMRAANPMTLLDSLLLKNDSVRCRVSATKADQRIILSFPSGQPVREIVYTIDNKSGFLTRITQIVSSRQLYDPSVRGLVEGNASYAIVETDLTNYREDSTGEGQLDLSRYYRKEGSQYVTVAPYDSYKIFLGSPDL